MEEGMSGLLQKRKKQMLLEIQKETQPHPYKVK